MKIKIDDYAIDHVVAKEMKRVLKDNSSSTHPLDIKYDKRLKKAAKIILEHYQL